MERRRLLKYVVSGIGLFVASVVGVPILTTGISPAFKREPDEDWHSIGSLSDFPVGTMTQIQVPLRGEAWQVSLEKQSAYVWRESADQVVVFSRSCTDLGCPIQWDPGSQAFLCPCHGGIFAKNGDRLAGPPKRPLYRFSTRIQGDVVQIDLNSLPPVA